MFVKYFINEKLFKPRANNKANNDETTNDTNVPIQTIRTNFDARELVVVYFELAEEEGRVRVRDEGENRKKIWLEARAYFELCGVV